MKQPDELILLGNMDGFESANRVYSGGGIAPTIRTHVEGQLFLLTVTYEDKGKQQTRVL